jgi:hypothetical protein
MFSVTDEPICQILERQKKTADQGPKWQNTRALTRWKGRQKTPLKWDFTIRLTRSGVLALAYCQMLVMLHPNVARRF